MTPAHERHLPHLAAANRLDRRGAAHLRRRALFHGRGRQKAGGDAVGPSSFSRSAIGYAGIAEILRRLGIAVVKSQYDALAKLRRRRRASSVETKDTLAKARAALLILPKWHGEESAAWAQSEDGGDAMDIDALPRHAPVVIDDRDEDCVER